MATLYYKETSRGITVRISRQTGSILVVDEISGATGKGTCTGLEDVLR